MTHDLIVFAEDWGGLPSSTQHLIKQLAKTRKVVWINSIGLRQPTLNLHDMKRVWAKLSASKEQHSERESTTSAPKKDNDILNDNDNDNDNDNSHFFIINPRTIPAPRSTFARYIAQKLLLLQIKPILQKANLHAPILWTSLPTAIDY